MKSFIDDYDKMKDFFAMDKDDFLTSYSYLSEKEYDETLKEFNQSKIQVLPESSFRIELFYDADNNSLTIGNEYSSGITETIKSYDDLENSIHDYLANMQVEVLKVNPTIFNVYEDAWLNNEKQPFENNLLYYQKDDGLFVALDNSTGNCWVEEFDNETQVIDWLTLDQEEYDKKYDNSYKKEDLLYVKRCGDYDMLRDSLTDDDLQKIDKILYDFNQHQFKDEDEVKDYIGEYEKNSFEHAEVLYWYLGLYYGDTKGFINDFITSNKEQDIEL